MKKEELLYDAIFIGLRTDRDTIYSRLSKATRNLWEYGDISSTQYTYKDLSLVAGTYIISALVTSADTDSSVSAVVFANGDVSNSVGSVTLDRGSRKSASVTLSGSCTRVYFFASTSSSTSASDTFSFKDIQIEIGNYLTPYIDHFSANDKTVREKVANDTVIGKKIGKKYNGSFDSYESPSYIPTVKKNERYYFNCNITTLGTIAFGLYNTSLSDLLNRVTVDSTNLTVYDDDGTSNVYAHGLTIAHNLTILIENDSAYNAVITLISDGEIFKKTGVPWNRKYYGRLYARELNGADISNVTMGWLCKDINKDIWMFGDSYFSWTDRWFYYFHQYGYDDNVLMDAYSGEGSVDSLASLYKLLSISTPKCIVWCLGMNDGSDSGAPSATWLNNITMVTDVCEKLGIALILATIPTVPTVNNEYKNAWVKASGYRYIDFANAVGAQADGTWFSGMLSNDGVHPTEKGAKALFAQVIADLPEVMITDY